MALRRKKADRKSSTTSPAGRAMDLEALVAELHVHRAELEAQNETLRKAQQQLEESRDRYADLFDFAPVAYVTLDERGIIRNLNITASTLLQIGRRTAIGLPMVTMIDTDHQSRFWDHLARCRRGLAQLSTEIEIRIGGGPRVPVEFITCPASRHETFGKFRTAIIDLRERRLNQEAAAELVRQSARREEAEESSRTKDEFFSVLAHELRTPLNAVHGWVHLLTTGRLSEAETRHAIEVIERNVQSQVRIINDMLDLSRVVRGALELREEPVDLITLIRTAVDSVKPDADQKSIRIESHLDSIAGHVMGDPDRLNQILFNLLGNAVKFTPAGGRIEIRLKRAVPTYPIPPSGTARSGTAAWDECARLTIADTGIGIPPEELPKVFKTFWTGAAAGDRKLGGLGLGLAITQRLVELHGGRIEAFSDGLDCGSSMVVELPLARAPLPAPPGGEKQPAPRDLKDVCVLVVDDDPETRELVKRLLEPYGARVTAVESAAAAFDAVRRMKPDVLVSDLAMPEEDGYSLMRRIRELPPEEGGRTPAIALSAHGGSGSENSVRSAGFETLVSKPVDADHLGSLIHNLVRARREKGRTLPVSYHRPASPA